MIIRIIGVLCLSFLLLASPPTTGGEVYKWVDSSGTTVYGSKPPKNARLQEIKGNITSFTSVSVESFKYDSNLITTHKAKGKSVIMYSTSWCGYCKKAARHFQRNNIPFEEYDIEKSKKAARDYKKLNGRGVPLILIGNKRMNGFSARQFDRIYNSSI